MNISKVQLWPSLVRPQAIAEINLNDTKLALLIPLKHVFKLGNWRIYRKRILSVDNEEISLTESCTSKWKSKNWGYKVIENSKNYLFRCRMTKSYFDTYFHNFYDKYTGKNTEWKIKLIKFSICRLFCLFLAWYVDKKLLKFSSTIKINVIRLPTAKIQNLL